MNCRFEEGSRELKGLGKFLKSCLKGKFGPFFFLQENYGTHKQTQGEIPITAATIEEMCSRGLFNLGTPIRLRSATQSSLTRISLCLQEREYPHSDDKSSSERYLSISGFPRSLFAADTTELPPHVNNPSTAAPAPILQDIARSPPAKMQRTDTPGSGDKGAGRGREGPLTTYHSVLKKSERRRLRRPGSYSGISNWFGSVKSDATTVGSRPATSATDSAVSVGSRPAVADMAGLEEWK
jgi:hypothetical protein